MKERERERGGRRSYVKREHQSLMSPPSFLISFTIHGSKCGTKKNVSLPTIAIFRSNYTLILMGKAQYVI